MDIINVLANAIALAMLWLFASAGLSKLIPANRHYYQNVFRDYGIALPGLAAALVWLLGCLELLGGLLIVFPLTRLQGLIVCGVLLVVYMLAMARQLWQGRLDMDCGCTGSAGSVKVSPALLLRNSVFTGLLVVCFIDLTWAAGAELSGSYWLMAVPMGMSLILINQSSEQLLANAQKLRLLKSVV